MHSLYFRNGKQRMTTARKLKFSWFATLLLVFGSEVLASDLSVALKFAKGIFGAEMGQAYQDYVDLDPNEALAIILSGGYADAKSGTKNTAPPFVRLGKLRLAYPALRPIIEEASLKTGLPPELIDAVIRTESGYRPQAVSKAGAQGLMQLMPKTARGLGVDDPLDPRQNVLGGSKYLRQMLDKFGRVSLALAAYNAGPHAVKKYKGVPPYKETQAYVKVVWQRYQMRLRQSSRSDESAAPRKPTKDQALRPSSYE
jgi:soluble lytic murein transglycosylase-like protein